jgi:adenylate kinase family enzyme
LKPAFLFVIGASGVGKTTAVRALGSRHLSGVRCYSFDDIGVPTPAEMEREWGSGERWQEQMTKRWIERLAANPDCCELALLEGQTRPSFIQPHLTGAGIRHAHILLLDCTPAARLARLRDSRGQPELAGARMDAWAVYLRGQADALGIRVLDTSDMTIEAVADVLEEELDALARVADLR